MSSLRSIWNRGRSLLVSSQIFSSRSRRAAPARSNSPHRLRIESLESRRMLTTYLVDSLADVVADDGMLTLREAILAASENEVYNEAPAGSETEMDEIHFAPSLAGGALVMTGTHFNIEGSMLIRGPEGASITIDAGGPGVNRRVFDVGTNADAILSNLTITGGCRSDHGSGIRCFNGTLTLVNSVVTGNSAGNQGGAISAVNSTITIINSTIAGNSATNRAGGVHLDTKSTLTMYNSILAQNWAPDSPDLLGETTGESSHNLIGGEPGFVRAPGAGGDGTWLTADDDRGDLRLASSSPAIDAGDTAMMIAPGGQAVAFDVYGDPRVSGVAIDIGASEFQQSSAPEERLPGDATGDRKVDAEDAATLAKNWGKSGMKWADGDFNDDGVVNALDAAILAANFGRTLAAPAEAGAPEPASSDGAVEVGFVGPLLVGEPGVGREIVGPTARKFQQGTNVPRSPDTSRTKALPPEAATDAALSEGCGFAAEAADVLTRHSSWSGVLGRRLAGDRQRMILDEASEAVDLLFMRP